MGSSGSESESEDELSLSEELLSLSLSEELLLLPSLPELLLLLESESLSESEPEDDELDEEGDDRFFLFLSSFSSLLGGFSSGGRSEAARNP